MIRADSFSRADATVMSRQEIVDGIKRKVKSRDLRTLLSGHRQFIHISLPFRLSIELEARDKTFLLAKSFINCQPSGEFSIYPVELGLVYSRIVSNDPQFY